MNLRMGSQVFVNVQIPLLWGERAIVQDSKNRVSIIDLSGDKARVEVLADEPAPGVAFRPGVDGIIVLQDDLELYAYNSKEKTISALTLPLPDVQLSSSGTRIGTNWFAFNYIEGSAVGIAVRNGGIAVGAPLPPKLARLEVR